MADTDTDLPEGTDTIINGAAQVGTPNRNSTLTEDIGGTGSAGLSSAGGSADTGSTSSGSSSSSSGNSSTDTGSSTTSGGGSDAGLADRLRSSRDKLSSQAGERARGLVSQGLERSAEALAGVGRMVGDTATGIDERLGNEYGDYARRAASAIETAANTIASKDPDELIDDARGFVRNSPGIALAGAAVVGFVVARLVKSGLASSSGESGEDDRD